MGILKKHEELFGLFQKLTDALVVLLAWFVAYYIRFEVIIYTAQAGLELVFLKFSPVLSLITLYVFYRNGLYKSLRYSSRVKEILAVFQANTIATFAFVIFLYFFAENRLSRGMLLIYFLISSFVLIFVRISIRNLLRYLRRKGFNLRYVLLIGHGPQLEKYIQTTKLFKDAGISFIGWIDSKGASQKYNIQELSKNLDELKKETCIDNIVIGYPSTESFKTDELLRDHYNDIVPIQVLPDLSYSFIGHQIEDFAGIPIMTANQPKLNVFGMSIKRFIDFSAAFFGLLFLLPLFIIVGLIIKLTSKGPIFFSQERMGLDGQNFKMWKFRTMKLNDPKQENQPGWTVKDDPRRTRIGSFLRATSIDELPQLWNVLKGDMSLVGPRPEQPYYVDKFKKEITAYMLRHKMKAGITGWAQVNGWRGDTSLHKRIECDIYYIKHWSLWFDIKILFLTIWKGFIHKNAY